MTWILAAGAGVCAVYYIIIVIYSGFTTSFSLVWLLLAVCLIILAFGRGYYQGHRDKIPLWVPVSAVTLCGAFALIFVVVEILVFLGAAGGKAQNLDYLIVLGAKVKEDGISKSLQNRLDKAIEYMEQNKDTVLVLSGGRGADEPVSEARAMRDYLVFNGVPGEQLLLEEYSTSTVENIAYSRLVIEADKRQKAGNRRTSNMDVAGGEYAVVPEKPVRIGVLTSDFHVFRASQIAQKWGIPDIQGVPSRSDPVLFVHFCVRECAAILKDKLMGNM